MRRGLKLPEPQLQRLFEQKGHTTAERQYRAVTNQSKSSSGPNTIGSTNHESFNKRWGTRQHTRIIQTANAPKTINERT
jgi:hypothetical protein